MPTVFTAENMLDRDPFLSWSDSLSRAFVPLEARRLSNAPFSGKIVQERTGSIRLSRLQASPHHVVWNPIASGGQDAFVFVNLQLSGKGITAQHGRKIETYPFDIALADIASPYDIFNPTTFDLISLEVPRAVLPSALLDAGGLALSRSSTGRQVSRVIMSYAHLMLADRPPGGAALLCSHILHLLGLATQEIDGWRDAEKTQRLTVETITDYIQHNAGDPVLSARKVANAFGVTERYVNKLLSREGRTFGQLLLAFRLDNANALLSARTLKGLSITAIALECGFSDPSFFARCFRRRFGEAPRDFRNRRDGLGSRPC